MASSVWYTVWTSSDVIFSGNGISGCAIRYLDVKTCIYSASNQRILTVQSATWERKKNFAKWAASKRAKRKNYPDAQTKIWTDSSDAIGVAIALAFCTNAQLEQCISNGIHLIVCNNDKNKMPIRLGDCCVGNSFLFV